MRYFIFLFILMVSAGTPGCEGDNNEIQCSSIGFFLSIETPTKENLYSLSENWIVGENGVLLHFGVWSPDTPQSAESPTKKDLYSVFEISKDDAWAVGNSGVIIHWNGNKWNLFESPTKYKLNSVYFLDSLEGWAVGKNGTILHYEDGKWNITESPTQLCLRSVAFIDKDNGWAVGDSGIIIHYNGNNWEIKERITDKTLYSVAFKDSSEGWAVGGSSRNDYVVMLKYYGGKWEMEHSNPNPRGILYSIAIGHPFMEGQSDITLSVGEDENNKSIMVYPTGRVYNGNCPKLNGIYFLDATCGGAIGDSGIYFNFHIK